jgi:hypothetical protein
MAATACGQTPGHESREAALTAGSSSLIAGRYSGLVSQPPVTQLRRIQVEEGFLDGLDLTFTPGLNGNLVDQPNVLPGRSGDTNAVVREVVSLARRRQSVALRTAVALLLIFAASACDQGLPSTEQQMRSLGLPMDSLVTIDENTQVTERVNEGVPELLMFTPAAFGGSVLTVNPATRPTVNGGMVGKGEYGALQHEDRVLPAVQYLFGAGQGPIGQVQVDEPTARAELVNREINGWLIVVDGTVVLDGLTWRLLDPDGAVLFDSVGLGLPGVGLKVDATTEVSVRVFDGVPQLWVFTSNSYGGADLAKTVADHPTVSGGLAGTASSPGFGFVFGGGQGPLRSADGVIAATPDARTQVVNATTDGLWVIVVPEATSVADIEWSLVGPNGQTMYQGVGLTH